MVQSHTRDCECKYIAFHEGRRQECPGEGERELRHERQVRNNDARVFSPLAVSDRCADERLEHESYQDRAGDGGDVDSGSHSLEALAIRWVGC